MIGSAPSRRTLLGSIAGAGLLAMAAPARAAGAIKHYILVELLPGVDQLALDRWYMTYHAPEVRRAYQAWQRNYVSFRSYLPPEEARTRFGVGTADDRDPFRRDRRFSRKPPQQPLWRQSGILHPAAGRLGEKQTVSQHDRHDIDQSRPAVPVAADPAARDLPYIRWILFQRYPPGVAVDEGEAWFEAVQRAANLPR